MGCSEPDPGAVGSHDAQSAAPPQSKLVLVKFPDKAKVDQTLVAIVAKLMAGDITLYRLAVVEKDLDGKILLRDIDEEAHGIVGAGALIGGLAGLAGGPLGVVIGASAGALAARSAELVNEQAVTEFANRCAGELAPGSRGIVAEVAEQTAAPFAALAEVNGGTICQ